jgi:hypothetical protein
LEGIADDRDLRALRSSLRTTDDLAMTRGCLAWVLVWPAIALLIAVTSWFGTHHMPFLAVLVFLAGCALIVFGLARQEDDEDYGDSENS